MVDKRESHSDLLIMFVAFDIMSIFESELGAMGLILITLILSDQSMHV